MIADRRESAYDLLHLEQTSLIQHLLTIAYPSAQPPRRLDIRSKHPPSLCVSWELAVQEEPCLSFLNLL
jgi:hypothetical protein